MRVAGMDFDCDGDIDCLVGKTKTNGTYGAFASVFSIDACRSVSYILKIKLLELTPSTPTPPTPTGTFQGVTWYYERDSDNNVWEKKSIDFFGEDLGSEAAPYCGDLDGDGDADCLVGRHDGRVVYYENTCDGSNECTEDWPGSASKFWANRGAYVGASGEIWDVGSQCSPHCVDVDQDGTCRRLYLCLCLCLHVMCMLSS